MEEFSLLFCLINITVCVYMLIFTFIPTCFISYCVLNSDSQIFIFTLLLLMLLSHFNCVWLCGPIDSSPPGSTVPGSLQARTLEWVAISFSSAWKWKVKVKSLSRVWLFATPWTAAHQAPPSMGFSRQEYWSGVHCHLWIFTLLVCNNRDVVCFA